MIDVRSVMQFGGVHLAEQLGPAVEILASGEVGLRVVSLAAGEHAVGADVDEPGADPAAGEGEPVRQQRVDLQARDRLLGGRAAA